MGDYTIHQYLPLQTVDASNLVLGKMIRVRVNIINSSMGDGECFCAVDLVLPSLLCYIIPCYSLIPTLLLHCYTMAYIEQSNRELMIKPAEMDKPICQIITPVGMLGYGFDEKLTYHELTRLDPTIPIAIILDSGSTDSGPQKLALGSMTSPRSSYVKDLSKLLKLVHKFNVPLIFASAGGDGTDEHVKEMEDVIAEICEEDGNRYVAVEVDICVLIMIAVIIYLTQYLYSQTSTRTSSSIASTKDVLQAAVPASHPPLRKKSNIPSA